MSRKLYAYQWQDGDLTFLMAADRGGAFNTLDQISGTIDLTRLRRVPDGLFALTLHVDEAGRLVLATEENEACEVLIEVLDEYQMRPHIATDPEPAPDEDDGSYDDEIAFQARLRLRELHKDAEGVAIQYVRARLSEAERGALDARLPSTLARHQRRKDIQAELALTLPKLKARLKTEAKQWMKDYASYVGDAVPPARWQAELKAKFKQIDEMTEEDQARGHAALREELAELDAEERDE